MRFKAKLRKIGNSLGILIPKEVITFIESKWGVDVITKGDTIYLEVITDDKNMMDLPCGVITEKEKDVITKEESAPKVITSKKVATKKSGRFELCPKHPGSMKITCGCK